MEGATLSDATEVAEATEAKSAPDKHEETDMTYHEYFTRRSHLPASSDESNAGQPNIE